MPYCLTGKNVETVNGDGVVDSEYTKTIEEHLNMVTKKYNAVVPVYCSEMVLRESIERKEYDLTDAIQHIVDNAYETIQQNKPIELDTNKITIMKQEIGDMKKRRMSEEDFAALVRQMNVVIEDVRLACNMLKTAYCSDQKK